MRPWEYIADVNVPNSSYTEDRIDEHIALVAYARNKGEPMQNHGGAEGRWTDGLENTVLVSRKLFHLCYLIHTFLFIL